MKQDVYKWVKHCEVCQINKGENVKYPGLLQPLPLPVSIWSHITMDFIEGLPRSEGKSVVIVDRLTKYAHFIPLSHPYTAPQVAKVFLDNIHKLHGLPESIVTDRDKICTSKFWRELFKLLGTSLKFTTALVSIVKNERKRREGCAYNLRNTPSLRGTDTDRGSFHFG